MPRYRVPVIAQTGLFDSASDAARPLADRMRPRTLDEFIGQEHILGPGKPLRAAIEAGRAHSMIFWGPPGTGKTTLGRLVATHANACFLSLSAVLSGVKEIREVIAEAKRRRAEHGEDSVLFVDEAHRFNKSQQDAFLPHVENGTVVFIGATTENPSFELNNALLSRARVYVLEALGEEAVRVVIDRALAGDERGLGARRIEMAPELRRMLAGSVTLRTVASHPPPDNPCIAQLSGVSLHAGTCCRPRDRDSLERLCRYIARPAVSNERLSVNDRAQVVYRLKHPFGDGTTHVVLDPIDFIARLAALVPRPRAHLTRYHGVFAPNFKHRHRIIPNPVHPSAREPQAARPAPMRWMQRLERVFHIDIEYCGLCGGTLRVIACIETPELIERILTHLAARNTECIDRPRAPPLHPPLTQPPACPSPALS